MLVKFVNGSKGISWYDVDKVYIPVNISYDHWFAVVVDMKAKKIIAYDSLRKHTRDAPFAAFIRPMCTLLPKVLQRANIINEEDSEPWDFERPKDVPQQTNG